MRLADFVYKVDVCVGGVVGSEFEDVTILRVGDGEQELVFPVSAHAGSADLLGELDDAWRVWALGYHVAGHDEVVVLVVEVDLLEEMLQFLSAAMDIADEDESAVLLRQMLLVHVADLDHALELWPDIAAVAHRWCVVHEMQLRSVCCVSRPKVCPPTYQKENRDYEIRDTVALYPPGDSVGCACDRRLELWRNQEIVVACVEAFFFVGYVKVVAVVWYLLDEGSRAVLRMRIGVITVRRHRDVLVEGENLALPSCLKIVFTARKTGTVYDDVECESSDSVMPVLFIMAERSFALGVSCAGPSCRGGREF